MLLVALGVGQGSVSFIVFFDDSDPHLMQKIYSLHFADDKRLSKITENAAKLPKPANANYWYIQTLFDRFHMLYPTTGVAYTWSLQKSQRHSCQASHGINFSQQQRLTTIVHFIQESYFVLPLFSSGKNQRLSEATSVKQYSEKRM